MIKELRTPKNQNKRKLKRSHQRMKVKKRKLKKSRKNSELIRLILKL